MGCICKKADTAETTATLNTGPSPVENVAQPEEEHKDIAKAAQEDVNKILDLIGIFVLVFMI